MKKLLARWLPHAAVALSFVLGAVGYRAYFLRNGAPVSLTDLVFVTIRLFILEADYTVLPLNAALDIARYAAPLSLAGELVSAFLRLFSAGADRLAMRRLSGHAVICGDSPEARSLFLDARAAGRPAVFLRKGSGGEPSQTERRTVDFERLDPEAARACSLGRAERVIVAYSDDAAALAAAADLAGLLSPGAEGPRPELLLAFRGPEWMALAEGLGLVESIRGGESGIRCRYLCGLSRAVRRLTLERAPDAFRPVRSPDDPPMAIGVTGSGACARELLARYALGAHYVNRRRPAAYVPALDAELREFAAARRLDLVLDLREAGPGGFGALGDTIAAMYFCDDSLFDRLASYRAARAEPTLAGVPKILVKLEEGDLLERLSGGSTYVFDLVAETSRVANLADESADRLARAIHEDYLAEVLRARPLDPSRPTHRRWELLPEEVRERNRLQADGILVKARSLGCEVLPESEIRPGDEVVSSLAGDELLEAMSEAEHERWCAVMYAGGWTPGKVRDDARKVHSDLVPYAELSEEIKQYDRNAVLNLPRLLGLIGLKLVRRG